MTRTSKIFYLIFFSFAVIFIATLHMRPYPFVYLVKAVPIYSLAALAFLNIPGLRGKLIGLGLVFSGVGDIVLELAGDSLFAVGLGAFLTAHLFYIAAFTKGIRFKGARGMVAAAIMVYGCLIGFVMVPNLGDMLVPVLAYLLVIVAMGVLAALGGVNHWLVVAGACLFIASDSLIAVNRFIAPVPNSGLLIMATYYPAQLLITAGASLHGFGFVQNLGTPRQLSL
ncbi:hypothetical protein DSCW_34650 [Desulfosarcina widdelii]|uniref:Lysoplasmalogenase n=1 Tax=Desulfosarcina widdelii TaxID=947919 RepID=A0A5K7Z4V9_9BACT|nr:lysoplasmalogenase [Desulfosarcina widdelii]BBO76048.1 hypothetical protein DSCW_34650 [Desulfosarcina widdelii]